MNVKRIIRTYVLSLDFLISIGTTIVTCIILPTYIKTIFAQSFYNSGMTVLSIIFSLFFTALTFIMSSSDNDFILFFEERNHFSRLMVTFKFTLYSLFVSLLYSIILYTLSDFWVKEIGEKSIQLKWYFLTFEFLFLYSIIATLQSAKDTVTFSTSRTKFLVKQKEEFKRIEAAARQQAGTP